MKEVIDVVTKFAQFTFGCFLLFIVGSLSFGVGTDDAGRCSLAYADGHAAGDAEIDTDAGAVITLIDEVASK